MDLEWMTKQRDQYKAELDTLNPKHDEAVAALSDARTVAKAAVAERDSIKAAHEQTAAALAGKTEEHAAAEAKAADLATQLAAANAIVVQQRALIGKWYTLAAEVFATATNETHAKG